MHIHFKEDQSLEERFWPHIRAQLLPWLENIDPHHAVFAIRRALESEYGAVAAVLAAAVLIFILTTKGFALDTAYGVGLMLSIAVIGLYLLAVGIYRRRAW